MKLAKAKFDAVRAKARTQVSSIIQTGVTAGHAPAHSGFPKTTTSNSQ